jgi:hypothetical protein
MELEDSEIRHQVERLLNSKALEGSEVHRRLLSYLAEKTLAGEADRLKEYVVALDALGKPATYDPRHDSVVRIQVGRLRVKLAEYYQQEGAADGVVVSLPKGGFKLQFEKAAPRNARIPDPGKWRWTIVGLSAAVVFLAAWVCWAMVRIHSLNRESEPANAAWNAELGQLWAPFLEPGRPLVVCIGAPLFLQYPSLAFIRDPGANSWEDLASSPRYLEIKKALTGHEPVPWFAFTGVGEASGAFQLGKLLGTRRQNILLTRSNLLSWEQIADTDLVFLGPPKFNTQLLTIPIRQEVTLETNGIRIRNPGPNEPDFLKDSYVPGAGFEGVTYALISCTPGLSGQGELLVLGGNATPDTGAAVQWLTQPWRAKELVSHLRLPSGVLPRFYQVVLRVRFKNGTPVESSYVLHRVLQAPEPGSRPKK